jgi:hypothetical protein
LACWDGEILWEISSTLASGYIIHLTKIRTSLDERLKTLSPKERTPMKIRNLIMLEQL